mmetsp:Transcript_42932/g.43668  ORF Transcript_42932/g.43668 Transcript_42932/m.43668 type:complete len:686 (-) Transcript_42932:1406-3463(-)
MSALTYDQTFESIVAISCILIILSAVWIICILINIEKTKIVALSTVLEDDDSGNDGGGDLQFDESTTVSGKQQLEVEPADGSTNNATGAGNGSAVDVSSSRLPTRSPARRERGVVTPSSPRTTKKRGRRKRRVSNIFVGIQCLSVSVLILLTYLLLVVSGAPIALRILGSLCVFGIFLRYQIGDEIRRQRVDRIMLLLSLFLVIASMLSTAVYSMKSLSQGEIYEGPARIVGYDMEQYNNTQHDPTTRTDIAVSWGKDWGCPLSGGKVCQARIQGAMCQTHPDDEQTKHKPNYDDGRLLEEDNDEDKKEEEQAEEEEEALEEDLEDEENSNQDLENENESLEEENEELKEEIEELKEENEVEEEEEDELVDEENSELNEIVDEYDEDIMIVEEEEYEDAEAYVDAEYEMDEESIEEKFESTDDDAVKEELSEEYDEDVEDQELVDEEYEEDEEYFDEYADEFEEDSEEEYEEFSGEIDVVEEEEDEKEELKEEIEDTEDEINDTDEKINHKDTPTKEKEGSNDDDDDVYEEMGEEIYEEEEEYEEEEYEEWYWDEYPDYYDDDYYEDDYWDQDWDSVWGDYACEDLFDSDVGSKTYDVNTPAGGDDEWPFVNIYGSCKTCEAYILDIFAEEAFEEVEEYKQQAIVYLAGALAGFIWATMSYVKYRVMPTAENEIELLGGDGGVMA